MIPFLPKLNHGIAGMMAGAVSPHGADTIPVFFRNACSMDTARPVMSLLPGQKSMTPYLPDTTHNPKRPAMVVVSETMPDPADAPARRTDYPMKPFVLKGKNQVLP